ncbi:hypothetical protein HBA92_18325 [Ochrobactrum sp. MR28]|nr:hypothetical protein [Ochrobactrum sp. MR28]MBX8817775.1 hypothetical protein [Ochrobactrum sp. MR31]
MPFRRAINHRPNATLVAYQSLPDREWFYHFNTCGYGDIIHVDIFADSPDHRQFILSALQKINVPGEEIQQGFRVFGYLNSGQMVDYL